MLSLKKLKKSLEKLTKTTKLRKSAVHKDGKFHASMVAVFVGPEMLFIRRDDSGLLTRPGGHAEPGEDSLSAAVRELDEEVGIKASPEQLKFVGKKETPRHGGGTTVVSVFKLVLPTKPELDYSKDPDQEASSCVWSEPSKIKESELHHKPDVVMELLKPMSLKQLNKSVNQLKPKHGWLVKIVDQEGYHPLKDIKDLGYNQGNNYVLHDGREFHQTEIEDMIPDNEEKLKKDMPNLPPPQAEVRQVEPPIVTHPTIRRYQPTPVSKVSEVISHLESSGGKNRDHDVVQAGVHKGTKAYSSYGLMPKLLQELAQKNKNFAQTPTGMKILATKSPEEVNKITADVNHDNEAMRHLWQYNQSRISKFAPKGADMELLGAYAHRRGVKGTHDALKEGGIEAIKKDPYVSKFQQMRNKFKTMGKSIESDVIPGGLSDKKSDKDFDPKLVKEGVKVELEHTSDPKIAKEIAQDHISESPSYYKMLRKLESLMKAKFNNQTYYPDKEGEQHPTKPDQHAVKADGRLVWSYKPEHAARMDANLARDVKDYSAYLSPEKKKMLNDLHNVIKNDPNRHVISNTGNSPAMRQRHFHNALRAKEGYGLSFDNGITVSAERHSGSNKTNNQKDSWNFDGKGLKFIGSEPISKSMGENNENTTRNRLNDGRGVQNLLPSDGMGVPESGRNISSRNGIPAGARWNDGGKSSSSSGRDAQAAQAREASTSGKLQSAKQLKKSIEELNKAFDPKDWNRISKGHYPEGENTVTAHEPETSHIEYNDWQTSANKPDVVKRKPFKGTGISTKMIHEQPNFAGKDVVMVKPYHQKHNPKALAHSPILGWSTITNRDLYHAGGIPHLVENVHSSTHQGIPVTVHIFDKDAMDNNETDYMERVAKVPKDHVSRRKIAIMDYLTDNLDRHEKNFMWKKVKNNQQENDHDIILQPLAIDHERSFQYTRPDYDGRKVSDLVRHKHILSHDADYSKQTPAAQWWDTYSEPIKQKFYEHLNRIKDPALKNHIKEHFDMRHDHISHWAAGNTDIDLARETPYVDNEDFLNYLKLKAKTKKVG